MHLFRKISFVLCLFHGFSSHGQSAIVVQDSLQLSAEDAEGLFLRNNFQLLAAKFQINAADAAIIQAKLYPNPNLFVDQGAYNPETNNWFDLTKSGETAISLNQIILLAGKRNKQINLARINSQIATYQFYDLIRTLRYELQTSFYGLYFLRQSIPVYDKEIESLRSLIEVYTTQFKNGNVAFKDLARLQALQFSLSNERMDILKEAEENQSNLILLTGDTLIRKIIPIADTTIINRIQANTLDYQQLVETGIENRYDLRQANATVQLNETNLELQKSLRVPDITLGANWDRQGSYITNYNSLSIGIDLPLWNRNQGNIQMAQYQIAQAKQLRAQSEDQVRIEINEAYNRFLETDNLYKTTSSQFTSDYEKLLDGITKGYQNHTISLLEFIDYYETYKDSKIEFNRLQNDRLEAIEKLNLATGSVILK